MSEYKNPLLDAMIEIKKGNFDKKHNSMLYPIMRWNSGCDKHGRFLNFESSFYINQYIFIVPQKMTMHYMMLSYKLHKNFRTGQQALWLRFPKKTESKKNAKLDIVKKYLKHIYEWSESECMKNIDIINYYVDDKDFIDWLDNYVGFEKKEKKLFKIKCNLKVKKNVDIIEESKNSKSLLDF